MEFVEYMKNKNRMTEINKVDGLCGIHCYLCPLFEDNNGEHLRCAIFEKFFPEKAEALVKEWAEEHPEKSAKTRQDVFLSSFPNPIRDSHGIINICPTHVDRSIKCECECDGKTSWPKCSKCIKEYWLAEIEEVEE